MIVRVRIVLKRTVVGDWRFDNLSESHLQSQAGILFVIIRGRYKSGPLKVIGHFNHDSVGWKTRVKFVISHQKHSFSELLSAGRSHCMNYWYSWVQTIYYVTIVHLSLNILIYPKCIRNNIFLFCFQVSQKEQKRERTMALMWIGIPVLIVGVIGGLYMSFSW